MPIYFVIPTKNYASVLTQAHEENLDVLADPFKEAKAFLVNFAGTPAELGRKIGIHEERKIGEGVIQPLSGHFGYANNQIWTWIQSRREKSDG